MPDTLGCRSGHLTGEYRSLTGVPIGCFWQKLLHCRDFFKNEELKSIIPDNDKPTVTIISYYEIMAGIQRLKSQKEEKFFRHFFSYIEILEFNLPAADIASSIAARMAATGNRVNAFDILIAGIALFHHADAIITADTDFTEIAKYADFDVIRY